MTEKSSQPQRVFGHVKEGTANPRYVWHLFTRTVSVVLTRRVFASVHDADAWRLAQTPSANASYEAARRINDCGWAELVSTETIYGAWTDQGGI
ncbi:MAG: hypothetical protein ILM98_13940 [Kiritimatiellae bacterium]|nr:hypothetical protein [Kiritimatiellia bacterium]